MRVKLRWQAGFTMIEILIVVVIIAVLAGVAFPVGRSMIARSREAACLGNLRGIGVGLQLYLQDHNQLLPTMELARPSASVAVPVLETVLRQYVDGPETFRCPEDKEEYKKTGSSYSWNTTQNGVHMSRVSFFGDETSPQNVPLVFDKEDWHPSGTNFLYADCSSSNKARFVTGSAQ